MAAASRQLTVRYVGDDSSLRRTLSSIDQAHQSLSSRLQNVGKSIFRTGRTITTGLTVPLVAMGKVAVDEFTQLERVNAQTAAALESTGGAANVTTDQIHKLSSELGDLTAQDGEAVQETENLLLTFTRIRNEAGKGNDVFNQTSLAVQDMSAAMGQDAKSSAIQLGKALNDPITGLTSLRRVGVAFTEQQQKQITRLVENNDLLGAQKIILGEVNKEFGGSAKAMGDTASPATRLNLAFRDMAEDLGKQLSPILDKVVGWLKKVFDWFSNLSPSTKRWIVYIGLAAAALGPLIIVLGAVVTAVGAVLSPITLVIVGIGLLVAAYVKFKVVRDIVGMIARVFKAMVSANLRGIALLIDGLAFFINIFLSIVGAIVHGAAIAFGWIPGVGDKLKTADKWFQDFSSSVIDGLHHQADQFRSWADSVDRAFDGAIDGANNLKAAILKIPVRRDITMVIHTQGDVAHGLNNPEPPPGHPRGSFGRGSFGRGSLQPIAQLATSGGDTYVVNLVVEGSVTADRDLTETIRRELIKIGRRNGGRSPF